MENSEKHYSIEELAGLVDLPVRTIRYYISEGLLAGPGARGKAALYGEEHLLRLRLIRLLSRQYVPLVEMRNRLAPLSVDEIRTLLANEEEHTNQSEQTIPAPSEGYVARLLRKARSEQPGSLSRSPGYMPGQSRDANKVLEVPPSPPIPAPASNLKPEAKMWQRWELRPGIELHIRADSEHQHHSLLERLFKVAGIHYPSPDNKK